MGKTSSKSRRLSTRNEANFPVVPALRGATVAAGISSGGRAGGRVDRMNPFTDFDSIQQGDPVPSGPFLSRSRRGRANRQAEEIYKYQNIFRKAFGVPFSSQELTQELRSSGKIPEDATVDQADSTTIRSGLSNLYDRYNERYDRGRPNDTGIVATTTPDYTPSVWTQAEGIDKDPNDPDDLPDTTERTTTSIPRLRRRRSDTSSRSAQLYYGYNYGGYYDAPRRF